MVAEHRRSELDNMAQGLGLDSWSYPNKRTVAEAILIERERLESTQVTPEEAPKEIPEEYLAEESAEEAIPEPAWEEVVNEVVKLSPNSVRGKIQAYTDYRHSMEKDVATMKGSISELSSAFNDYCTELAIKCGEFNDSINALSEKYSVYNNVEFAGAVNDFNQIISNHSRETQQYIKNFYG